MTLESWWLEKLPSPFTVNRTDVAFAVIIVMAGDGDLSGQVYPDLEQMQQGISPQLGVLALVDGAGQDGSAVVEVSIETIETIERLPEICTGDPRPIADFFARALVSYSQGTRFALGFWGHGEGVFGEIDTNDQALPMKFRNLPLGEPITLERVAALPEFELPARIRFIEDLVPKRRLSRSFLPDLTSENRLTNREISSALTVAFARARRREPVDMIFFDTCLGGSVEVFTEVRRFTKMVVCSAIEIPGGGWDYEDWLRQTAELAPADAKAWAKLTVESFEQAYDQDVCEREAQLGAWTTDIDFVGSLFEFTKLLAKELGSEAHRLLAQSAFESGRVVFGNNIDLGQLLGRIRENTENPTVKTHCEELLSQFTEARLALSKPPPFREHLSGMTIWFPLGGRGEELRQYWFLEFNQITRWLGFVMSPAVVALMKRRSLMISGYWGLELAEAGPVKDYPMEVDQLLRLPIREEHTELAAGLVEGHYRYAGSAGEIRLRNSKPLEELLEALLELSPGFEPLRACYLREKVLGPETCQTLANEFRKHNNLSPKDLYRKLGQIFARAADSGVVIFHWAPLSSA